MTAWLADALTDAVGKVAVFAMAALLINAPTIATSDTVFIKPSVF